MSDISKEGSGFIKMSASSNRVAIVTGSATGVGAATSILLVQRGWNVVINYSRSEKEARETVDQCVALGGGALLCRADVSDDEACRRMVDMTLDKWGRLDALVNNAGTTRFCDYSDLDGLTEQDFVDLYRVNVIGAYQMTRAAAPHLKLSDDGAIVITSSIAALTGIGSSMAYAASKGALNTLTLSLAQALGPKIRVNAVCPGFIQGRWTKNFLGENYEAVNRQFEQGSALKKTAVPEDVAKCIVHLVCDAQLVTGEITIIDGGSTLGQVTMNRR
jgi:3-oxoacyl-[acyl-carrier protein] reductase